MARQFKRRNHDKEEQMILEHKEYELFGKMIFEKVILTPPFQKSNTMPEEACFFYVIDGIGEVKSFFYWHKPTTLRR